MSGAMTAGDTSRRNGILAFAVIAALLVAQACVRFHSSLNHDTEWFLLVARGLLDGKHLYTDYLEVNPPLGIWLTVPIVWLAATLNAGNAFVMKSFFLVISASSIALVNRYMRLGNALQESRRLPFIVAFSVLVLFLPGADFGEREHLVFLLFAPWLLLRLARNLGARINVIEAICIGMLAAVAIVLKPQSVFAPIFVEALLLWHSRRLLLLLVPENISAGTTVVLYAISILLFTPEYLADMVPLGRAAYLPFYGYPAFVQVFNGRWCLLFILGAVFVARHIAGSARLCFLVLLCAALGFALSFGVQNKGFSYQVLPATVFAGAALSVAFAALWNERAKHGVLLAVMAGITALRIAMEPQQYRANDDQFIAGIKAYAPQAKSIFIASTRMSHGFPLVAEQNLQWASRLPTQWLAPYVASKWHDGALPDDKYIHLALETIVTDMVVGRPDIIFIDQDQDQVYVPGGKFDYVKFWSNDPRFAFLWLGYQQRGIIDNFAVYTPK